MKFLALIFMILSASLAQASVYTCSASIWSKGLFGTYFILTMPQTIEMPVKNKIGEIRGLEIGTANFGKLKFVLNGTMDCSGGSCSFDGTLTEIVELGFLGQFYLSVSENQEKLIGLHEDRVLKISCERE